VPLRVAIISSPRSGNTWLRHLLMRVAAATGLAVHNPADIVWEELPAACIVQLHWHCTPEFCDLLARHGFRIVVQARHPLDLLISILHFALHDGSTARWLEGEAGLELPICGAMPCSSAFLRYAVGQRAKALLGITAQWWNAPGVCRLRYEDLVDDPVVQLEQLLEALGVRRAMPLEDAVAATTIPRLRALTQFDHHFWQGCPGLWKRFLPPAQARHIADAHADNFTALGYDAAADPSVDTEQADASWLEFNRAELTQRLWHFVPTKQRLQTLEADLTAAKGEVEALMQRCRQLQAEVAATTADAARARAAGPRTLAVVLRLRSCARRIPGAARLVHLLTHLV
jgi:hypothetical protein